MTDSFDIMREPRINAPVELAEDRDSHWTTVAYKCRKCGALDHDRILDGGSPAPLINCWNCGSGRKQPTHADMQMAGTGMVLVSAKG